MRKNRLFVLLPIIVVLMSILATGCDNTYLSKYEKQISDYRYIAMRYEGEQFSMDVIGGVREFNYAADGVSDDEKVEYTVFTLTPKADLGDELKLKVTLNDASYELVMSPHPFKDSYSTEINTLPSETEMSGFEVSINDNSVSVTPCEPLAIDGELAMETALEKLGYGSKKLEGEFYLRLTENTISENGGWYWYFALLSSEKRESVLMDAQTGEVRAIGS